MDYLFLHRDKRTFTSERQKNLLFRAARLYWEQKYADNEVVPKRKVDCELYKYVLYYLEVRQVFLDPKLSLKKLSDMIETNQTYLSNVVNRYFGCHLKELVNTYRVEYAKELLRSGKCLPMYHRLQMQYDKEDKQPYPKSSFFQQGKEPM